MSGVAFIEGFHCTGCWVYSFSVYSVCDLLCVLLCAGGICWSCVETLSSRTAYTSSYSKFY